MAPDKLKPDDARVESCTARLNGKTYHYLLGNPDRRPLATVLLFHGFPDLSFGWRYQVPFLLSRGLRVIVPDLLGYGLTDAPESLSEYSTRSVSADIAALVRHVFRSGPGSSSDSSTGGQADEQPTGADPDERIILGGHDWGGFLAWRFVLWHPELVRAVFCVCTPYAPPRESWTPLEAAVAKMPNLAYQVQFAGPDVEAAVVGPDRLRRFLSGMYLGSGPAGEAVLTLSRGIHFENLDLIRPDSSPLLDAAEMDLYAGRYAHHGDLRGGLNWYRTRRINYEEELELARQPGRCRIAAPSLVVLASKDGALPPALADGMERYFDDLTKREVRGGHWVLWEAPEEVNRHLGAFLDKVLRQREPKALI